MNIYSYRILLFQDISIGNSQTVHFALNQNYSEIQHIIGALSQFLSLSNKRIKNRRAKTSDSRTIVSFKLNEIPNETSNKKVLNTLEKLVNLEKFKIIDNIANKTCIAIKGSFKYGKKKKINALDLVKGYHILISVKVILIRF
jgi:hypothetical protein